jgi:hypothetical protein
LEHKTNKGKLERGGRGVLELSNKDKDRYIK